MKRKLNRNQSEDRAFKRYKKALIDWTKTLKDFDPNKSFVELPAFRTTFFTGFLVSAGIAIVIALTSELSFGAGYTGFNLALEAFKVPLGVLAVTIPVIALLGANHRSSQTKEQIKLANEQNRFSNHFKHLEEFEKHCAIQEESSNKRIKAKRSLHSKLFAGSKKGNYKLSDDAKEDLSKLINFFSEAYTMPEKQTTENKNRKWYLKRFAEKAEEFRNKYNIVPKDETALPPKIMPEVNEIEHIAFAKHATEDARLILGVFEFDEEFSPSKEIEEFTKDYKPDDVYSESREIYRKATLLQKMKS